MEGARWRCFGRQMSLLQVAGKVLHKSMFEFVNLVGLKRNETDLK